MRTLSLNTKVSLKFKGNVYPNALVLADADNDQKNELLVGSAEGEMAIFKGNRKEPWKTAKGLGNLSIVQCGDVLNTGRNVVVTISIVGWVHFLEVHSHQLTPVLKQRIPSNVKQCLIFDVNNDGEKEIVVALSDRVVRSYKWKNCSKNSSLVPMNKWEFGSQVGGIAQSLCPDGTFALLVSQPGASLLRIYCDQKIGSHEPNPGSLSHESLVVDFLRDSGISCEIQGGLEAENNDDEAPYAICTLDGTLMLAQKGNLIWSKQLGPQLFGLHKFKHKGDDLIAVSSWSGKTYVLDQTMNGCSYAFGEGVSAFTCGNFSLSEKRTDEEPVFVFVTFTGAIQICYNFKFMTGHVKRMTWADEDNATKVAENAQIDLKGKKAKSKLTRYLIYKDVKLDL